MRDVETRKVAPRAVASKRVRLKPDERRAQVLSEATRLLGERGYYGFSIEELARRCGVTNAGLLHHFGSKEALLVALLRNRDDQDRDAVTVAPGSSASGRKTSGYSWAQIGELFHRTAVRNAARHELVRLFAVLQAEALHPSHPAYDYFLERETKMLAAFVTLLEPHTAAPRSLARQLIALIVGLEQQWLRADQSFDFVAEWDLAFAMASQGRGASSLPTQPNALIDEGLSITYDGAGGRNRTDTPFGTGF